jgi:hypothetical protein
MFQDRLDAEVLKVLAFYKRRSQELLQVSSAAWRQAASARLARLAGRRRR